MISDFIEVNGLGARIISFPSDTTFSSAAKAAHLSDNACAKAVAFVDEKMDFYAVIASLDETIRVDDAEGLFGVPLFEASEEQTSNLTGFEKNFFPPIAVFGAKVAFHSSTIKKKTLLFRLSPREYLVISKEDIQKSQGE